MVKRVSVGQRLADDQTIKKGLDALFNDTPAQHSTGIAAKQKKFEKGTFYFDPDDLAQLEKVWLQLMAQGIKCNKSEIVSILLRTGLDSHEENPTNGLLTRQLTGKRRRS